MSLARKNAIVPLAPSADHTGLEGYAVKLGSVQADGTCQAVICSALADVPFGVILDGSTIGGANGQDSVAVCAGGFAGVVRVKLSATPGTVTPGTRLAITATGTFKAEPGTGTRSICAMALESGIANELIAAVLFPPVTA